jgi:hypothetical protein
MPADKNHKYAGKLNEKNPTTERRSVYILKYNLPELPTCIRDYAYMH